MINCNSAARRWLAPLSHGPSSPDCILLQPRTLAFGGIHATAFSLFLHSTHSVPSPKEICVFYFLSSNNLGLASLIAVRLPLLLLGNRAVHSTPDAT